ncbi:MAG: hypothetical protein NXI10_12120 [bacterium]|nr:hypothetical protein [bacterium]
MENSEAPEIKTMPTEHHSFDLVLSNQVRGEQVLENPSCHFTYDWNKDENMGIAMLQSINETPVNIVLHPLGIKGQLDFMSDMEPKHVAVNATNGNSDVMVNIIINRVILDVVKDGNEAAIMFNEDGGSIQSTPGFMEESAAKQLPEVEFETPDTPLED